jgi:hypothetical protein
MIHHTLTAVNYFVKPACAGDSQCWLVSPHASGRRIRAEQMFPTTLAQKPSSVLTFLPAHPSFGYQGHLLVQYILSGILIRHLQWSENYALTHELIDKFSSFSQLLYTGSVLDLVLSYEKQDFHSETPPPFNLSRSQNTPMGPSGAYAPTSVYSCHGTTAAPLHSSHTSTSASGDIAIFKLRLCKQQLPSCSAGSVLFSKELTRINPSTFLPLPLCLCTHWNESQNKV